MLLVQVEVIFIFLKSANIATGSAEVGVWCVAAVFCPWLNLKNSIKNRKAERPALGER